MTSINTFDNNYTSAGIYHAEMMAAVKEKLGTLTTEFSQASLLRGILYGIANGLATSALYFQNGLKKSFLQNLSGEALENAALNLMNLTRLLETKSKVELWAFPKTGGLYSITPSTTFYSKEGHEFKPTSSISWTGTDTRPKYVTLESVKEGEYGDCSARGIIDCSLSQSAKDSMWYTNLDPSFDGYETETDEELRVRLMGGVFNFNTTTEQRIEMFLQKKFPEIVRVESLVQTYYATVYVLSQSNGSLTGANEGAITAYLKKILGTEYVSIEAKSFKAAAVPDQWGGKIKVLVNNRTVTTEIANKVALATARYLDLRRRLHSFSPALLKKEIEELFPDVDVIGVQNNGFQLEPDEVITTSNVTTYNKSNTTGTNVSIAASGTKNIMNRPRYLDTAIFG